MNNINENIERESFPRIIASEVSLGSAKVKVVGVGGAGGNAVNRMVKMGIPGVEFLAINTDALALENSLADDKVAIGQKITKTLGAGAKPDIGRKAILEDRDLVAEKLQGADLVFIAAGMGGGTGTGAAPVVAEIARKLGILTVAVVSMPFKWEGPVRSRNAKSGVAALREAVDTIIVINNQKVLEVIDKSTTMEQAFGCVDEVLGNAVKSVCDIMLRHGNIHVDFNDVRSVMENGGDALMGTGIADGDDRALRAAEAAINCPLLDDVNIAGASGVLVNVSHGENFTMQEYSTAMAYLYESVGDTNDPSIIVGDITIPELGDKVSITVIATGFPRETNAQDAYTNVAQDANVGMPRAKTATNRVVETAIPRPTANFASLASVTPAAPVTATPAYAPMTESPYFESYQEPTLDVRSFSGFEEEVYSSSASQMVAKASSTATMEMPAVTVSAPAVTVSAPRVSAAPIQETRQMSSFGERDENPLKDSGIDYSVPAFLRNNKIQGDIF